MKDSTTGAGFEGGGRGREPRKAGGPQKLEKAKIWTFPLGLPVKNIALWTPLF